MRSFLKENLTLVIAFSLPILLLAVVAISTLLPSSLLSTDYDFIYASCSDQNDYYNYRGCDEYLQKRFSVQDGKLLTNEAAETQEEYSARIFLHNTENNESREISIEAATQLDLNQLITSPDGITVSWEGDRGVEVFLVFDSGSSYGYYLTKGNSRKKLNLVNTEGRYYYRDNFQFIGWVLPGRNN